MGEPVQFFVRGVPRQKGSWRAVTKTHMKPTNEATLDWIADVRAAALTHFAARPSAKAFRLTLTYYFVRPKKHYRTGKHSGELRADAPVYHVQTPDLDKLDRAVFDALTHIVYVDDCQVVRGSHAKYWVGWESIGVGGVQVCIEQLED